MSNLIIIPGQEDTTGPAVVEIDDNVDLLDHVLMLNLEKQPRFACGGFSVSRNMPIGTVTRESQQFQIRRALRDKILVDITGKDLAGGTSVGGGIGKTMGEIDKAIKARTLTVSAGEEVGPKMIMGKDAQGNTYMIIPKDEADYERMQEEARTTGSIRRPKPATKSLPSFSGLLPIVVEDLPKPPEPDPGE